jgi:hypothetical protein
MQNAKLCRTASDVPTDVHWAIVRFGTLFVPGIKSLDWDGTEDKTVPTTEYWAYSNKRDWEEGVASLTLSGNKAFVAIASKPATATVSVVVG